MNDKNNRLINKLIHFRCVLCDFDIFQKLAKLLKLLNEYSHLGLLVLATFSYFYTVEPVFTKALLEEKVAEAELRLEKFNSEYYKNYAETRETVIKLIKKELKLCASYDKFYGPVVRRSELGAMSFDDEFRNYNNCMVFVKNDDVLFRLLKDSDKNKIKLGIQEADKNILNILKQLSKTILENDKAMLNDYEKTIKQYKLQHSLAEVKEFEIYWKSNLLGERNDYFYSSSVLGYPYELNKILDKHIN